VKVSTKKRKNTLDIFLLHIENQKVAEKVTHYERVSNNTKVNRSKVKESKENNKEDADRVGEFDNSTFQNKKRQVSKFFRIHIKSL